MSEATVDDPVTTAKGSDGAQSEGRTDKKEDRNSRKLAEVINVFQDRVNARTIGMGAGSGEGRSRRAATGKLEDEEIRRELRHYCKPDGYGDAVDRLHRDRVIILCGPAGLGKRAGGISLLREVTHKQLVVLSAVSDAKQLSTKSYQRDTGYLIVNRTEADKGSEADFAWLTIRSRVRDAGGYLVVTTLSDVDKQVQSVRQLAWPRPDLTAMARAYLVELDLADDVVARIVDHFHVEPAMTEIAAVLVRIRDGEPIDKVLDSLAETSARRVQEWFDGRAKESDLPARLDVSVLAMLGQLTHRDFDLLRQGLETAMRRHGVIKPVRPRRKAEAEGDGLDSRLRRTSDDGLLVERRVVSRTSVSKMLDFRTESYREHTITELARRSDARFWTGVAEWLAGIVVAHGESPEMAEGLALLAAADFDEVEHSYLTPWSQGAIGPAGQATAVFVLWAMCFKEETMPIALQVAKQWANHGDGEQRWAAAMTYSGELGRCEPAQAIKQLWQLIASAGSGYEYACLAMAALFDTLLGTTDATKVLATLSRQLHRVPERREHRVIIARARRVLAELLAMRENQHHVPVTFLYMQESVQGEPDPDASRQKRIDTVARLWAEGIRCRPYRAAVLEALWYGLSRLEFITDDPILLATQLGEALVATLPANEVDDFYDDLQTVGYRRQRRTRKRTTKQGNKPALVLLDVVGRYYRRKAN